MEVIARKQEGLLPLFITVLALGIVCIGGGVVCCVLGGYSIIPAIVLTLLGVVIVGLNTFAWCYWKKMPAEIVRAGGDDLELPTGKYSLAKVVNVSYRCPFGIDKIGWGKLCIELGNKKYVCYFVENVEETQKRLRSLRLSDCNAPIDR